MAELGLLVPNVELNTGCAPEYLPGGPPGQVAQGLVQRVVSALGGWGEVELGRLMVYGRASKPDRASSDEEEGMSDEDEDMDIDGRGGGVPLDPTAPPVVRQPESAGVGERGGEGEGEVKGFYTLNLHVYVLSLDHGANGLFDAVWMAVVAALATTRLPEVWVGDDGESVNVDWERPRRKVLRERGWPVASSFGAFRMGRDGLGGAKKGEKEGKGGEGERSMILADPDAFEEGLCEEVITLLVREEEGQVRMLGMEKQGGGVVGLEEMRDLVKSAGERCKTVNKVLEKECRD
ncbi:MAG: hypothetical protein OHK93_004449 [Ramalina farinacea]|uniref:Ribosomal RNA-processing protein 43 n=1 Tax=Ramalina farinacea TaxID=258253 RepID=A0AA43QUT3_9LECA|nr:hypothetical protein [Ramalina farinacea]